METTEPHSKPSRGLTPAATEMRAGKSQSISPVGLRLSGSRPRVSGLFFLPFWSLLQQKKLSCRKLRTLKNSQILLRFFVFLEGFFFFKGILKSGTGTTSGCALVCACAPCREALTSPTGEPRRHSPQPPLQARPASPGHRTRAAQKLLWEVNATAAPWLLSGVGALLGGGPPALLPPQFPRPQHPVG